MTFTKPSVKNDGGASASGGWRVEGQASEHVNSRAAALLPQTESTGLVAPGAARRVREGQRARGREL